MGPDRTSEHVVLTAIAHLSLRGGALLSGIVISRLIDPTSFAIYSYFSITTSTLATYASLGVGVAATRYFAQLNSDSSAPSSSLALAVLAVSALSASLISVVVLALPSSILGETITGHQGLLAASVFAVTLFTILQCACMGIESFRNLAMGSVASSLVLLAGSAVSVRSKQVGPALWSIVLAYSSAVIIHSTQILIKAGNRLSEGVRNFRTQYIRELLCFVGPVFMTSLVSGSVPWAIGRFLITKGNSGLADFATFSIGLQWFAIVMFLPGMLSKVFFSKIARHMSSKTSAGEVRGTVRSSVMLNLSASGAVAISLSLFGPLILKSYGATQIQTLPSFIGFLLAGIIASPVIAIGNAVVLAGGQVYWFVSTVVWATLLLTFAWILSFSGVLGIAVSYIAAYGIIAISSLYKARRDSLW